MKKLCPETPVKISEKREIILSDTFKQPWPEDPKGYFLVKIEQGTICCGFVEKKTHTLIVEFKGTNVFKMIQEIAKRKLCNLTTMGYIASELMIVKRALEENKEYKQR